jgi:hypothetical protein
MKITTKMRRMEKRKRDLCNELCKTGFLIWVFARSYSAGKSTTRLTYGFLHG